jgi:hypothetical protein
MKPTALSAMSVDDLLARFAELAIQQELALEVDDIERYSQLYKKMETISDELEDRGSYDMFSHLLCHNSIQVRLAAARRLMWTLPAIARPVLEHIAQSGHLPQAGYAGMALEMHDSGWAVRRKREPK